MMYQCRKRSRECGQASSPLPKRSKTASFHYQERISRKRSANEVEEESIIGTETKRARITMIVNINQRKRKRAVINMRESSSLPSLKKPRVIISQEPSSSEKKRSIVEEMMFLPAAKKIKTDVVDDDEVHNILYQNHLPISILQNSHDFATQPYLPITTYRLRNNFVRKESQQQRHMRTIRVKLRSKLQEKIMMRRKTYNQPKTQTNITTTNIKQNTKNKIQKTKYKNIHKYKNKQRHYINKKRK